MTLLIACIFGRWPCWMIIYESKITHLLNIAIQDARSFLLATSLSVTVIIIILVFINLIFIPSYPNIGLSNFNYY